MSNEKTQAEGAMPAAWHAARNAWTKALRHGTQEYADSAAIAAMQSVLAATPQAPADAARAEPLNVKWMTRAEFEQQWPMTDAGEHPAHTKDDDLVLVERGLLGAACAAIDKKRDAPVVLARLREVTMSPPSAQQAVALTDDARDAARYRYLRSRPMSVEPDRIDVVYWSVLDESANEGDALRGDALDEAIDAALQSHSHSEGDQP